ncbi:MAG TPA: hypothetical protein VNT30_14415 [Stellaceae bacterium]|nr:hypothetical protein [Stellaceae bacterium]
MLDNKDELRHYNIYQVTELLFSGGGRKPYVGILYRAGEFANCVINDDAHGPSLAALAVADSMFDANGQPEFDEPFEFIGSAAELHENKMIHSFKTERTTASIHALNEVPEIPPTAPTTNTPLISRIKNESYRLMPQFLVQLVLSIFKLFS